jgi:hypothetical protein
MARERMYAVVDRSDAGSDKVLMPLGAYDRAMRDERRTAVLVTPSRVYSNPS